MRSILHSKTAKLTCKENGFVDRIESGIKRAVSLSNVYCNKVLIAFDVDTPQALELVRCFNKCKDLERRKTERRISKFDPVLGDIG